MAVARVEKKNRAEAIPNGMMNEQRFPNTRILFSKI